MKRIKEIRIKNFKAFQDEQCFDLGNKGKNVLVYGSNGSGKSSLFWAIYTLIQSSTKTDHEVRKYFENYIDSDSSTHQTLKNVYVDELQDSYIKFVVIDTETRIEETFTISHDVINTNKDTNTIIQELNLASDFINYKLLQNFYRASHKQEVNLWPVFEHDIFPLLTEGTRNWLEDIIKAKTKDVPRTPKGAVVSRTRKQNYIEEINDLNRKISGLLTEIQNNANAFIKDHFYEGKDVIRITLNFTKKFRFDNIRRGLWEDNNEGDRHDKLHINLMVEINENKTTPQWRKIERVQSFLNEAQLTRIAISVRIGALRTRPLASAIFKVLVLDDMLISLDLSNRMDVMRIMLNKENKPTLRFFDDFQKIILTHDKGFFNLIRRNTEDEEWVYYNFTKDESENSPPKIKLDQTPLQKAIKYFQEEEFENCGNELRKETEAILTSFLDPGMKKLDKEFETLSDKLDKSFKIVSSQSFQKFMQVFHSTIHIEKIRKIKTDFHSDTSLSSDEKSELDRLRIRLFDFFIEFNKKGNQKELLLNETKEILDRVMNDSSHHSENPLYSAELRQAIEAIKRLKDFLNA